MQILHSAAEVSPSGRVMFAGDTCVVILSGPIMYQGADVTCVTQDPGIISDRPGLVTSLQIKSSPRETLNTIRKQAPNSRLGSDLKVSQDLSDKRILFPQNLIKRSRVADVIL